MDPLRPLRDDLKKGRRCLILMRVDGWPVSYEQLAAMTGLHPSTIRAWETYKTKNPRPETVRKIHNALLKIARRR